MTNDGADEPDLPDVDDETVVEAASNAAKGVIFSRYTRSEVTDVDVTVTFEDGQLEIDVYLDADGREDPEQVAEDAVLAARSAADDLLL